MTARNILMSAAGAAGGPKNYIEDVFSTYLYTGNGSTQTINNGIDLAGSGGMVWIKKRDTTGVPSIFGADLGGPNKRLRTSTTDPIQIFDGNPTNGVVPTSSGFNLVNTGNNDFNDSLASSRYVSWTFRKQPKFFDVVTYTGNGLTTKVVNHNLGSAPGMIIAKRTDGVGGWAIWHRGNGTTSYGLFALNDTSAAAANFNPASNPLPSATEFYPYLVWDTGNPANANGATYVAYLFAHNAGGFGLSGTDNVISCGSISGYNGRAELGYEPQFVLLKEINYSGNWQILDNMRGLNAVEDNDDSFLFPNLNIAELKGNGPRIDATGFNFGQAGETFIYIAIRRGPMKVPTLGTSVFAPITYSGDSGASRTITGANFPPDLSITKTTSRGSRFLWFDKLRGIYRIIQSEDTATEFYNASTLSSFNMNGISIGDTGQTTYDMNYANTNYVNWMFRRAPGFFDVVCYTGTSSNPGVLNHNLGVVPELMIVKQRTPNTNYWAVYTAFTGNTKSMLLPSDEAAAVRSTWNNTSPTATTFTVENDSRVFSLGKTYVAYLFATCPGVSKVGNYTGNGSNQTINCGFTAGARFVMIKRTNSTGDWYVWDTARGIVTANDPHLSLIAVAAEVTTDDSVDPQSSGFVVNQVAATNINVNGATYIFLAIA